MYNENPSVKRVIVQMGVQTQQNCFSFAGMTRNIHLWRRRAYTGIEYRCKAKDREECPEGEFYGTVGQESQHGAPNIKRTVTAAAILDTSQQGL